MDQTHQLRSGRIATALEVVKTTQCQFRLVHQSRQGLLCHQPAPASRSLLLLILVPHSPLRLHEQLSDRHSPRQQDQEETRDDSQKTILADKLPLNRIKEHLHLRHDNMRLKNNNPLLHSQQLHGPSQQHPRKTLPKHPHLQRYLRQLHLVHIPGKITPWRCPKYKNNTIQLSRTIPHHLWQRIAFEDGLN